MLSATPQNIDFSVVIPVFNSENSIGEVIDRTSIFFERSGNLNYEIILVNDNSKDASWDIIKERTLTNPKIIAVNLIRNYGQHTALYCGFKYSKGDFIITLDDDLQNPPEEIVHLLNKIKEGYDTVFGRYKQKQHSFMRKIGSLLIREVNKHIFHCPAGLYPTNFRVVRRDVVDRLLQYQVAYPYITGLVLMFSVNPTNVWVDHQERAIGKSSYTLFKLLSLVGRILFNYSVWPLRLVSTGGFIISLTSFLIGIVILFEKIVRGTNVQGWASIVVLLSMFNGVTILILGMLGEYIARILQQVSAKQLYHIKELISSHD